MNRFIIIAIVLIVIVGIGFVASQSTNNPPTATITKESDSTPIVEEVSNTEEVAEVIDSEVSGPETSVNTPPVLSAGTYTTYSAEAVAESTADQIVLFFHATWCPPCRALDRDITANRGSIPAGVAIFKADYDMEISLKQQYGVTRQHSVLLIDSNGTARSSITHPLTFAQLINTL